MPEPIFSFDLPDGVSPDLDIDNDFDDDFDDDFDKDDDGGFDPDIG